MKNSRIILSVIILVAGIAISYAVSAQNTTSTGITFPIPELGNCGSKEECRDYCDNPENMVACTDFAKAHGLMNEDEAGKAAKFAQAIRAGGTPGGCRSPQECEAFCSNVNNIQTCVDFAEKQGFKDKHVEEGKRILTYIKSGGQLPGGCTSKDSCETYCSDFAHAEECVAFAEKAGLTTVREGEIPPGQFQKFIELAKRGETPGQCKSKDQCESYCRDSAHFEECIAFGEKMSFIKPEEAAVFRKTGGKGPGGCSSREACEAFCNEPVNQETCFKFAEENGLIPKEELERARDGLIRMRQGLENAPPEVAACLKSVLGENVIADIQSGKLTPGPQIGEKMRACFEKFGESARPTEVFKDAPPQVLSCLKDKFGDAFQAVRSGATAPTPEMADAFRVCFQSVQLEKSPLQTQNFLRTAPPGVQACLKEKLGTELQELEKGNTPFGEEVTSRIKACFEEFRPTGADKSSRICPAMPTVGDCPTGTERVKAYSSPECGDYYKCVRSGESGTVPLPGLSNLPPEVLACVKETVGVDVFEKVRTGVVSPEIGERVKICLEKLRSVVPPPTTVAPPPDIVCAQVITPAQDPNTGACKEFPTPCDVPANWVKVNSCSYTPPPTTDVNKTYSGCYDATSCEKVCYDTYSSYYGSDSCVGFRSSRTDTSN